MPSGTECAFIKAEKLTLLFPLFVHESAFQRLFLAGGQFLRARSMADSLIYSRLSLPFAAARVLKLVSQEICAFYHSKRSPRFSFKVSALTLCVWAQRILLFCKYSRPPQMREDASISAPVVWLPLSIHPAIVRKPRFFALQESCTC